MATKIVLIFTLIGGLAAGYFAYMLNTQKQENIALYHDTDRKLKTTTNTLEKTSKNLADTQAKLADTQKNLEDTTSKANQLQDDLTKAQAKASDLEQRVAEAKQTIADAQKQAEDLKQKLGEQSQAAQEAQAKVTQLESDLKIKSDDLAAQKAEVARLQDMKARAAKGEMPPGIIGQVVSVNSNWNFVVLNVGEKQGVVPNGEFILYRNKQYICKVRVANTDMNTCVADVLVETQKGTVQVGDDAMN